jgi:hypothetical protein
VKLFWRQTSEAKTLLSRAKEMQSLRKPVSDIPTKCTKLVMEINHAVERFELGKKDKAAFLTLSQAFDRKGLEIRELHARIDALSVQGHQIEADVSVIRVPISDKDGVVLKSDVLEGTLLLQSTLDKLREKLESVESQLEEIREEASAEVK